MEPQCATPSSPSTIGLGIRTAIYLTWYTSILTPLLLPSRIRTRSRSRSRHAAASPVLSALTTLHILSLLFDAGLFLALLIQTTSIPPALAPAEAYTALLLASGTSYLLAPAHIWRVPTCFHDIWALPSLLHPAWDKSAVAQLRRTARFLLTVTLAAVQIWFFTAGTQTLRRDGCPAGSGFLFTRMELDDTGFKVFQVLLHLVVLISCLGVVAVEVCGLGRKKKGRRRRRRKSRFRHTLLQELHVAFALFTACVLNASVELTVQWNALPDAYSLSTAGQVIPLLVAAGFATRILWAAALSTGNGVDGTASSSSGSSGTSSSSSNGGGSGSGSGSGTSGHGEEGEEEGTVVSEEDEESDAYGAGGGGGGYAPPPMGGIGGMAGPGGGGPSPPMPFPGAFPPGPPGAGMGPPPRMPPPMAAYTGPPPPPPPGGYPG